jgi:hypothetical protein
MPGLRKSHGAAARAVPKSESSETKAKSLLNKTTLKIQSQFAARLNANSNGQNK